MPVKTVTNGGSAIGEAIGAHLELELHDYLTDLAYKYECSFLNSLGTNPRTGRKKKLLLYDMFGNDYNIDGVIVNEKLQPLILLESKYIRYKKHNRDKGSWICNAHAAIRKRYTSIRGSIAVLAGNWSSTSLLMLKSSDINIFLIPFDYIVQQLANYGVDFEWEESDRTKAFKAWEDYSKLEQENKIYIAKQMVKYVASDIESSLDTILNPHINRRVDHIVVEVISNTGERKCIQFATIEEAVVFFEEFDINNTFDEKLYLSVLDSPNQ